MLRDITLGDITAFVQVARLESFALAAEELHVTQSALSRRIKKLEASLGGSLLDRTTRSVSVSRLGLEFLPKANRIVEDFHRSLDDINEIVKVRRGIVSFSCNMTISDTLLPDILETFKNAHTRHPHPCPRRLQPSGARKGPEWPVRTRTRAIRRGTSGARIRSPDQ